MEELLVVILQFLFELALNIFANVPFDWPSKKRRTPEPETVALRCFLWSIGGCLLGWVSVVLFKHTLISVGALRMINVVVAPLASAQLSQAIARRRSQSNSNIVSRNH
jgi:hypothetical protein